MKQLDGILDRIMGGIFLNHSLSSRCFAEEYNGCRRKSYHKYKCYIDDGDCNCFDHSDSDEPRRGSSRQEEGCGTGEERWEKALIERMWEAINFFELAADWNFLSFTCFSFVALSSSYSGINFFIEMTWNDY